MLLRRRGQREQLPGGGAEEGGGGSGVVQGGCRGKRGDHLQFSGMNRVRDFAFCTRLKKARTLTCLLALWNFCHLISLGVFCRTFLSCWPSGVDSSCLCWVPSPTCPHPGAPTHTPYNCPLKRMTACLAPPATSATSCLFPH